MTPGKTMPSVADLYWPVLEVLRNRGGSASNRELSEHVPRYLELPDDVVDMPRGDGPRTELDCRLSWARTYLKKADAIDNTARGVWTITPAGREVASEEDLRNLMRGHGPDGQGKAKARGRKPAPGPTPPKPPDDSEWQEELLAVLRKMNPAAFERLCQRVLRESGFSKVEVTGRSGDGGIDGAGVLRVKLISFHVRFQCKRYAGNVRVQVKEIRDFRGAMVGRADKGLFMTTGAFTSGAVREAVRDGAPAIDLIDGVALCELLKKLKLGVSTRMVTEIRPGFFEEL